MERVSTNIKMRSPVYEPIVPLHSESFVWRRDDYPLPWCVWNSHPECEVHLTRKAQGTCYVGDHIGSFVAGDLYLIGRNLPHNWVTPLGPSERISGRDVLIQFDPDRLLAAAKALPELGRVERLMELASRGLSFYGGARRDGAVLVEAIGEVAGLRRLSLFIELLHLLSTTDEVRSLSSAGFAPALNEATNMVLRTSMQYMALHLDQDIRLSDLAAIAGMTETSFSRFFRKNTGNTFMRHLGELRIGKACQILASTDKPVTDVCLDVGYVNLSNFNRAFRELRGMTPGQYRRLARKVG